MRRSFRDVDDIPLGVDFKKYIDNAVAAASLLLVAIGPRWLSATTADGKRRLEDPNDFVRLEVEAALNRDIPVIPLLVGGAAMPSSDDLPDSLEPLAFRLLHTPGMPPHMRYHPLGLGWHSRWARSSASQPARNVHSWRWW